MPCYAQLNSGNQCVGVSETSGEINAPHMIPIDSLDSSLLGRVYDRAAQHWGSAPVQSAPRHISVGSLYDRFGPAKWGILADTSPLVQAVIKDASVRSYIDLDNPDLPAGLAILQAAGHTIDADSIVNAPIGPGERP